VKNGKLAGWKKEKIEKEKEEYELKDGGVRRRKKQK
jgi:hypothetical protein